MSPYVAHMTNFKHGDFLAFALIYPGMASIGGLWLGFTTPGAVLTRDQLVSFWRITRQV